MHARLRPKPHRFTYKICTLLIDLDQLNKAQTHAAIFSINKANLVSFHEKDHGPRDGSPLRQFVNQTMADHGLEEPARILLWCTPRVFGYTFNPLSVYFCYDGSDEVYALLYQVHNTFGESHIYLAQVDQSRKTSSIRQETDKRFYVSPFLDMDLHYNFKICEPADTLKIHILEDDRTGPILAASFSGKHKPLTNQTLSLGIAGTLGLGWKVTFAIHFEALKLWFKGISLYKRPPPPTAISKAAVSQLRDMGNMGEKQ